MEHITKRFGTFYANRDVSFRVRQGEIHALLGENGAGKSTLMNILAGLYTSTEGDIYIDGKRADIRNPQDARGAWYWHGLSAFHADSGDDSDRKCNVEYGAERAGPEL